MQMIGWARLGWFLWVKSPNSGAEMHTERVGAGAALLAPADDDKMAHFCQLRTERLRSSTSPAPPCTLLHTTAVWGPGAAVSAADCCRLGRGLQTPWTRTQPRQGPAKAPGDTEQTLGNHLHCRHKEMWALKFMLYGEKHCDKCDFRLGTQSRGEMPGGLKPGSRSWLVLISSKKSKNFSFQGCIL